MERPTGVTILAVLAFIGAGLLVLAALGFLLMGGVMLSRMAGTPLGMMGGIGVAFLAVVFLVIAALYVVIGVGFWKLLNWARILAIILIGLAVLFQAVGVLAALAHFHPILFVWRAIFLGIDVWIVVYLLNPNVKQAFGATGF
ncbi:MAG: hypothetical protein ABR973_16525 [Candidatus Acidiferrales bacterium]|jgi:uncharacterized membrane protein (DUF2068 family)